MTSLKDDQTPGETSSPSESPLINEFLWFYPFFWNLFRQSHLDQVTKLNPDPETLTLRIFQLVVYMWR
jgi:hypothetical protein